MVRLEYEPEFSSAELRQFSVIETLGGKTVDGDATDGRSIEETDQIQQCALPGA